MVNASVVVLSDGNNPKLLSHDFLARNHIVPEEWVVRDIVITPPFSNMVYENGVQFVVELNKLQVRANKPERIDCDRDLPKMVTEYLRVLPHVPYQGVGVNFIFALKGKSHDDVHAFLRDGPWLHQEGGVNRVAIEFNYLGAQPKFNVKIEPQVNDAPGHGDSFSNIIFTVNFHHDFKPDEEDLRMQYISDIKSLKARFIAYSKHLPFAGAGE